ncbi:MAG: polysaccharide lyase family 7 protein [Bacteroidota bacterium]
MKPKIRKDIASDGRLEVILNENNSKVYADIHMQKWGTFENYFKAGNYLQAKEEGSYASVKYYNLVVSH